MYYLLGSFLSNNLVKLLLCITKPQASCMCFFSPSFTTKTDLNNYFLFYTKLMASKDEIPVFVHRERSHNYTFPFQNTKIQTKATALLLSYFPGLPFFQDLPNNTKYDLCWEK